MDFRATDLSAVLQVKVRRPHAASWVPVIAEDFMPGLVFDRVHVRPCLDLVRPSFPLRFHDPVLLTDPDSDASWSTGSSNEDRLTAIES